MKFDKLCEFVLNESDIDYISGKGKIFSLVPDYEEKLIDMKQSDLEYLLNTTKLPFNVDIVDRMLLQLKYFMPAGLEDIKAELKEMMILKFGEEINKKVAADRFFTFMKREGFFMEGIPSKKKGPSEEELKELEKSVDNDIQKDADIDPALGVGLAQVGKLGGVPQGRPISTEFDYE